MRCRTPQITALLAGLALCAQLDAAELRQPLPKVHALVGVRVVTAPGEVLESATIVVRDGVIAAVGPDVEPPPDAQIIEFPQNGNGDGDGNGEAAEKNAGDEKGGDPGPQPVTVYPGLIEPYLAVELEDSDENGETPPGRQPLVTPDFEFDPAHWPAEQVEALRSAGFTTALIAPATGMFRGRSLLANLGDGGLSANLLRESIAQHAHLGERGPDGQYPQSLMGSVALFRQTLLDAGWQQRARAAWQRNPAQARPEWRAGLGALAPVLAGDQPLVFVADDTLDSLRILKHVPPAVELVLIGHGAEYQRLGDFDRKPLHILPLDFPGAPDVEDENDRDASLEELRHWKLAPENPARMIEAGFPVLLTAHEQSKPAELFAAVAKAVEHGLDAERALAALTTEAAEWLGIADRAGRIAPGYMANLVVVDGELFVEKPAFREVWVDGARFELAKLEPPEVDPSGTWALTLNFGGNAIDAELKLSGPPSGMTGTLTVMGNELALSEARVSGKTLRIKIESGRLGQGGGTTINLEIEGERGRGTGSGPFGEFSVRGRKSGGPGDESSIRDWTRAAEVQS